jgi:copper(I)-binding protein
MQSPFIVRLMRSISVIMLVFPITMLQAHEYYADGFMIIHPWANPTPPGVVDAPVYFSLQEVTKGDRLIRGFSPLAERVEFVADDTPNTPAVSALTFGPGETDAFGQGKPHVVMRGLKVPFQEGRSYLLMLEFEKAGQIVMVVSVDAH